MLSVINLLVFIIDSSVHLYASYYCMKSLRAVTKVFILLSLLGWYVYSVTEPLNIVIAAILTSWLGDVLLIPEGNGWFSAGGISFMISHVCFIIGYCHYLILSDIPTIAIILSAMFYFTTTFIAFCGLKPHLSKAMFYPMFFYLLINGTMNCFAFYQLLTNSCFPTIITFIGACLFYVSDTSLFYVRYQKNCYFKTHLIVMLTYILAEFLIVEGFILQANNQ